MRLWENVIRRRAAAVLFTAGAIAVALPAQARAENPFGNRVDDSVAIMALDPAATPETQLEVIVYSSDFGALNADLGLTPTHVLDSLGVAASYSIPVSKLQALGEHKAVLYVNADVPVGPTGKTTTSSAPDSSKLASKYPIIDGAHRAWERGITGKDVGIVVIDSGVTPAKEFEGRLTQHALDGQSQGKELNDAYGHGTAVASIAIGRSIDGKYTGIAPDAYVYALNLQRPNGVFTSDVIEALQWVEKKAGTSKNIRVVVLALSETMPTAYRASALDAMVERIWRKGIVVVASAGNLGPGAALYAPGNDPFAISVGALDTSGTTQFVDDLEATWSTSGFTQDGFSKPEVLAPGRRIEARVPGETYLGSIVPSSNAVASNYAALNGTSFSAPQVAGAVALIAQARPTWTPDQIKWVLMNTARSVPNGSAGALDIEAALNYVGEPPAANQGIEPSTYGSLHFDYKGADDYDKALFWNEKSKWDKALFWNKAIFWNKAAFWNKALFWNDSTYWDRALFWNKAIFWNVELPPYDGYFGT